PLLTPLMTSLTPTSEDQVSSQDFPGPAWEDRRTPDDRRTGYRPADEEAYGQQASRSGATQAGPGQAGYHQPGYSQPRSGGHSQPGQPAADYGRTADYNRSGGNGGG